MTEYEYTLERRFQDTKWRADTYWRSGDGLIHLLDEADRLNGRDWSRMEWRVVRRIKTPIEVVGGGISPEQKTARDLYQLVHGDD